MMRLLLIVLLVGFITSCAKVQLVYRYYIDPCYYDGPVEQSGFPQYFLAIDLSGYYQQLHAFTDIAEITARVQIDYNGSRFPILHLKINSDASAHKLLIFA